MPCLPLSRRSRLVYLLAVFLKRCRTRLGWALGGVRFAASYEFRPLARRVRKHQSLLLRKLGESDMRLQYNKVRNLQLAVTRLNGIIIRPGETFSFCRLVGKPTRRKGYLEGMELAHGEARPGTGGGICQLSNLINWLVLHSPLTITERHHHGFDPFPDQGRVLPFGSGATVFYNYVDYRFRNETARTFQLLFWVTDTRLEGELCVDAWLPETHHVYEKAHAFVRKEGKLYRRNELWREVRKASGGVVLRDELLYRNCAEVKYALPSGIPVVEEDVHD